MRYINKIGLIITLLILLQRCQTLEIDPYYKGVMTEGSINGKPWQNTKLNVASVQKCTKSIDLIIQVFNENKFLRETLGISKIPLREGTFDILAPDFKINIVCLPDSTLTPTQVTSAYFTSQDDGDVGKDTYLTLKSVREKNKLTITRLDFVNKYIEGEFDATYLLRRNEKGLKNYQDSPDTLRFTKVKFQSSIVIN